MEYDMKKTKEGTDCVGSPLKGRHPDWDWRIALR